MLGEMTWLRTPVQDIAADAGGMTARCIALRRQSWQQQWERDSCGRHGRHSAAQSQRQVPEAAAAVAAGGG